MRTKRSFVRRGLSAGARQTFIDEVEHLVAVLGAAKPVTISFHHPDGRCDVRVTIAGSDEAMRKLTSTDFLGEALDEQPSRPARQDDLKLDFTGTGTSGHGPSLTRHAIALPHDVARAEIHASAVLGQR
ncbi:hypothetical protein OCOJLMKI_3060 [Methylobacterium iners]|uniref:Uncharacterized protein n=2 Tax=Methylobacterium iners TaxID=418707 RepID=A0ABQ4RYF7_9HYPH|nr:hypothetical protein OCOJLMKI_3060 [Methylobacterium iners]